MIRFIDTTGSIALEIPYDTYWGVFREELLQVVYSQYFIGFINKSGELVIETPFGEARNFSEGFAVVKTSQNIFNGRRETKWGAIDKNGRIIFEADFDDLHDYSEEIAVAQKGAQFHFVNKQGAITYSFHEKDYHLDSNGTKKFSEGLIAVSETGTNKFGFMNKEGRIIIEPQFENAANFSEGLARVSIRQNHREYLGFINTAGEYVIEPKFDIDSDFLRCSNDFSEGLASLLDAPLRTDNDQNFIFIDCLGEIVINTNFFRAENFHDGLACVWDEHSETYGYIDKSGNLAIPLRYRHAGNFSEGLARVA